MSSKFLEIVNKKIHLIIKGETQDDNKNNKQKSSGVRKVGRENKSQK